MKKLYVSDEVKGIFQEAANKWQEKTVPGACLENDKYAFIYRAISDRSRLAALEYRKIEDERLLCSLESLSESYLKTNGILLKTGKVIKILFPDLTDHEVEVFAHYVRDELRGVEATSEGVLVSDNPSEIYTKPSRNRDDLRCSCMMDQHRDYFQIYDDIKCCRIAYVLDDDGYLIGRALLWDEVTVDDGSKRVIKIMDRCYFKNRDILMKMLQYGKENGYYVKKFPERADCSIYLSSDGEEHEFRRITINSGFEFTDEMYTAVPYFDTFPYCEYNTCVLSSWSRGNCACLRETNGRGEFLTGDYSVTCEDCGTFLSEEERYYDPNGEYCYCPDCYHEHYNTCESCYEEFEVEELIWVKKDGYGALYCEECAKEIGVYKCTICGSYHHKDDKDIHISRIENTDKFICMECLRNSNVYGMCAECCKTIYQHNMDENGRCEECASHHQDEQEDAA